MGVTTAQVYAEFTAVWALQGLNSQIVPQSLMTNNRAGIVIGALTLLGRLALARWSSTRR